MFRLWLARVIKPITKWVGKVHAPWTHKKISWYDASFIAEIMMPGDVLLSATHGELTYILTPGEWKHAGIVDNDRMIVEAVGRGVVCTPIHSFCLSKDRLLLLRPVFCEPQQARRAASLAKSCIGMPYDYDFNTGNGAFYCSELVTDCFAKVSSNWVQKNGTTLPSDFANAKKKFVVVYESKGTAK